VNGLTATNGGASPPRLGLILKMPATATVEMAGHAGFDLVLIDTEHGPCDMTELEHHCRAAECAGMDAWVRVSNGASPDILRALDAGARGIVVPHATSAADVAQAAALTRYPPQGRRSLALSTRAGRYGLRSTDDHLQSASRIALVAQIEDAGALEHVDEILAADGLTGIFIGPSDLSASLGHPGDPAHPDVAGHIDRVAQAVLDRPARALCVLVADEAEARAELDRGTQIVLLNAPALLGGRLAAIADALAPDYGRTPAP
jgi:4-hydroxy-2-oxoheptanedioate aldolase